MSFKFPTHPTRRKRPSVFESIVYPFQLMYYRYEVTFSAYVLTPGEKIVLNTIVFFLLGLLFAGVVSYLPPLVSRTLVQALWLYSGNKDQIAMQSNTTAWDELPIGEAY